MTAGEDTVVRHTITVDLAQAQAFEAFTAGHDTWWPRSHKIGLAELAQVIIEGRRDGRWYERDVDGGECDWGRVLIWEPPSRLVLAWQISGEWAYDADLITEVEVRFSPDGPSRTIVALEHRGLDAYGGDIPKMRDKFGSPGGWPGLLEAFATTTAARAVRLGRLCAANALRPGGGRARTVGILAAVGALVVALSVARPTASDARVPATHSCGLVSGGEWLAGGTSGDRWQVYAVAISCSFARRFTPALTHGGRTLEWVSVPIVYKDPRGMGRDWVCVSHPDGPNFGGVCDQMVAGSMKQFIWAPAPS